MTKTKRKLRRKPKSKPLGTIWELPDALWEKILPVLLEFWPKKRTGRRTADWRAALNGILFRMRPGCQWEQLPRKFGPKSTVPDWLPRPTGSRAGVPAASGNGSGPSSLKG